MCGQWRHDKQYFLWRNHLPPAFSFRKHQIVQFFRCASACCQRCQSRLHQKAQLEQIGCHLYFVRQKFQTERIFADTAACRYKGTRATADFYHTAADQCFDCFTQGTASNAERFCQFKFIRQLGARFQRRVQNIMVDLVLHLLGQQLVFQV